MASRSARDINRLIRDSKQKREGIKAQHDRLAAELAEVDAQIIAFEVTLAALGTLTDDEEPALPTKQIRNEMVQILRDAGEPLHYGAIYDQLLARNIPVPGKDPRRNVGAHLSNDERFKSLGSGKWGLVSWHARHAQPATDRPNVVSLRDRVRMSRAQDETANDDDPDDDGDVPSSSLSMAALSDVPV